MMGAESLGARRRRHLEGGVAHAERAEQGGRCRARGAPRHSTSRRRRRRLTSGKGTRTPALVRGAKDVLRRQAEPRGFSRTSGDVVARDHRGTRCRRQGGSSCRSPNCATAHRRRDPAAKRAHRVLARRSAGGPDHARLEGPGGRRARASRASPAARSGRGAARAARGRSASPRRAPPRASPTSRPSRRPRQRRPDDRSGGASGWPPARTAPRRGSPGLRGRSHRFRGAVAAPPPACSARRRASRARAPASSARAAERRTEPSVASTRRSASEPLAASPLPAASGTGDAAQRSRRHPALRHRVEGPQVFRRGCPAWPA